MWTPSQPRSTWPCSRRSWTICWARFDGIAKPMPTLPPVGLWIAVLTPITLPSRSKVGPPELPWLIGASICMKSSKRPAPITRCSAETMPAVTELPSPNGLPIAITGSPTRTAVGVRELDVGQGLAGVDLEHGEVGVRIGADHLRRQLAAVIHGDRNLAGIGDHVVVGRDVAVLVEDEAGTGGHHGRATRGLCGICGIWNGSMPRSPKKRSMKRLEHLGVRTLLGAAELALADDRLRGRRALHGHADHRRHDLLDQVGIAGPGRGRDRGGRRGGGRRAGVDAGQQRDRCGRGHRDRRDAQAGIARPDIAGEDRSGAQTRTHSAAREVPRATGACIPALRASRSCPPADFAYSAWRDAGVVSGRPASCC